MLEYLRGLTKRDVALSATAALLIAGVHCAGPAESQDLDAKVAAVSASANTAKNPHTLFLDRPWGKEEFLARLDAFYPQPTEEQTNAYWTAFLSDNVDKGNVLIQGSTLSRGFYDNTASLYELVGEKRPNPEAPR